MNILTTSVVSVITSVFSGFIVNIFQKRNRQDPMKSDKELNYMPQQIEVYEGGLDNYIENFKEWDTNEPLKILSVTFGASHLPAYSVLKKFKEVQVIIDISRKTIDARIAAVPSRKKDYRQKAWKYTTDMVTGPYFKNVKLVAANKLQYPVGIMYINGANIFYAPLWNHEVLESDSFSGLCLRIHSESPFGTRLIRSFEALYNDKENIKEIKSIEDMESIEDMKSLINHYGYDPKELEYKKENA